MINRTGPASVEFADEELELELNLGVRDVQMQCRYLLRGLRLNGRIKALLHNLNMGVRVMVGRADY